jgi:hypothetical protein
VGAAGAGESVRLDLAAAAAGYYCIAVWKTSTSELSKSGDYIIDLHRSATDAEELPSARIANLQVRPNPFNPRTQIRFELGEAGFTEVDILNERGSRVRTLAAGRLEAGAHELSFDGIDDRGRRLASGVYFVQVRVGGGARVVAKVVLLK